MTWMHSFTNLAKSPSTYAGRDPLAPPPTEDFVQDHFFSLLDLAPAYLETPAALP